MKFVTSNITEQFSKVLQSVFSKLSGEKVVVVQLNWVQDYPRCASHFINQVGECSSLYEYSFIYILNMHNVQLINIYSEHRIKNNYVLICFVLLLVFTAEVMIKVSSPILVTERRARSWSRCTGSHCLQMTLSHPGGRLRLLSARCAVTFPPIQRTSHSPSFDEYRVILLCHWGI